MVILSDEDMERVEEDKRLISEYIHLLVKKVLVFNFKNYTFKLRDGRRICFELVDASTEQNNNKSTEGMERRFDVLRNEEGLPVLKKWMTNSISVSLMNL